MLEPKNFDESSSDKKNNINYENHKSPIYAFRTHIHGTNNDNQRTFLQADIGSKPSTSRIVSTATTFYETSAEDESKGKIVTYTNHVSSKRFKSTTFVVNDSPEQYEKSRKFGTIETDSQVIPENATDTHSKLTRFAWLKNFKAKNQNKMFKGDNIQGNVKKVTSKRTRRMERVVATIGILLFLMNVSMLPFFLVLGTKIINPDIVIPGIYGFLSLVFLLLNSASNPIIFGIRLKPLRIAFFNMYKRICCQVCDKLNGHT